MTNPHSAVNNPHIFYFLQIFIVFLVTYRRIVEKNMTVFVLTPIEDQALLLLDFFPFQVALATLRDDDKSRLISGLQLSHFFHLFFLQIDIYQ